MKSMIEYDFQLGNSSIDLRNLRVLDLTCSDITLTCNFSESSAMNQYLSVLAKIQERNPTCNLKRLVTPLLNSTNLSFLGQISSIFNLNTLELTKTTQQQLITILSQSQLRISTLIVNLPETGFKIPIKDQQVINSNIFMNGHLRNLTLNFISSVNDNYLDLTSLLLKSKSIGTLKINLNYQVFLSDMNICKYFAYSTKLYKLQLHNIQLTNKNFYIQFCLYLSQNSSIQELEIVSCQLYDKLRQTLFNCLNERKPIVNSFILIDSHLDTTNINQICQFIQRNPLKHLELQSFLKDKPKMLPLQDIFLALVEKSTLTRLIIKDRLFRLGQTINRSFSKFIKSIANLQKLDLEFENFEDIFDQLSHSVVIQNLAINAVQVDKYAVNKLFFDIAQGHIQIQSLKLQGGFNDIQIQKIVHLAMRQGLKELDISGNQLTDDGAFAVSQFLTKAPGLHKLDISSNMIGDSGLLQIFTSGFSTSHRIQNLSYSSNRAKKQGKLESFRALQTFSHLKILDLGNQILITNEESEMFGEYLQNNNTLEDLKLPKIQIENDQENSLASYQIFGSLVQHKTLIYASLSFLIKALITYESRKQRKEDTYSLKVISIRKLTILNCNLDFLMNDKTFSQTLSDFINSNPQIWIKNQPPVQVVKQRSKSFLIV